MHEPHDGGEENVHLLHQKQGFPGFDHLCNCLFTNVDVSVFRRRDGSLAFKGVLDDKLYLVDFSKENANLDACLIAKTNMGWLWHRRLAHVGMKNLHKLLKGDHVLGLTDVCFEKDKPCAAC
jgi:hypothetical protein